MTENHDESYILSIFRGTPGNQFWEEFRLRQVPAENVISALMEIEKNPVNVKGDLVDPIVWEQGCLEEVCGSCSMLVNGVPRQGCTALISDYITPTVRTIYLAPLTKFPLVRDLIVDRSIMFENLQKIQGWIEGEPFGDEYGEEVTRKQQELMYALSMCMTCGCCSEACPQVSEKSDFMGPAAISQARLFNTYPGDKKGEERLRILMKKEGLSGCGQAQNCKRVCPKNLPLTESIAAMGKATTKQFFFDLLRKWFGFKRKKDETHPH